MSLFDINKCFDSIYTHSIAWAVYGRDAAKEYRSGINKTFAGEYDTIMQYMNSAETNGIVIGPEFSRIFAEIILQSVDVKIIKELEEKNIIMGRNYNMYRYVDDYMLFYNDESVYESVYDAINKCLYEYKMSINENKIKKYEEPLITEITMGKRRISELYDEKKMIKIESKNCKKIKNNEEDKKCCYTVNVNKKAIIISYKMLIKETKVNVRYVTGYALSIIARKVDEGCKVMLSERYKKCKRDHLNQITSLVDVAMYVYRTYIGVSNTIKLSKMLMKINGAVRDDEMIGQGDKDVYFSKIVREIQTLWDETSNKEYYEIDRSYYLMLVESMGMRYDLGRERVKEYVRGRLKKIGTMGGYMEIVVFIRYMKDRKEYEGIKEELVEHIKNWMGRKKKEAMLRRTEVLMTMMDLVVCPYLKDNDKADIMSLYDVDDTLEVKDIMRISRTWFTDWTETNLEKLLARKSSIEVY